MLRNRLLILLGGCLLAASAAWADDVGYVDCASHPDDTQVFAKARRSQDVVTTLPCGERFRIVLYGFIFSQVQTSDGKIGFIYSSVISIDRTGVVAQKRAVTNASSSTANAQGTTGAVQTNPAPAAVQTQPAATPVTPPTPTPSPTPAPAVTPSVPLQTTPAATPQSPTVPNQTQPTGTQPAGAQPAAVQPVTTQIAPATPAPETTSGSTQAPATKSSETTTNEIVMKSSPTTTPQPAPEQVLPTPPTTPTEPAASNTETGSSADQPTATRTSQPQPETVEAQPAALRTPIQRTSWEKPNPSGRRPSLLELFGGYTFARMNSGGTATNFIIGGLGSFGVNIKPWLQITGDSSYSTETTAGVKTVLYGNHFGPRYYFRRANRWGLTPFAEGLIGASRADTTVSGTKTSQNCISYKVGGGLDMHPSKHFEIRLIDGGYYRTAFGTNAHQNNYYASTGIVLQFIGGGVE